jgi:hypothetical protein
MVELLRAKEFAARTSQAEAAVAAAPEYDQDAWAILYGALAGSFGIDPSNFQLVYPGIAWNWPTESLGYIGPAAYDTLSTIPQFSAIGKYTSTGERFNDLYGAFLHVIDPATNDPNLRGQIENAWNDLAQAANDYDRTLQQAKEVYTAEVPEPPPTFTEWLGTMEGKSWQTKLTSLANKVEKLQAVYDSLVDQTQTPNLTEALNAAANQDYFAKLNDPNLKAMPEVPNWSTGTTSSQWRDRVERGETPGGSISVSNSSSSFDFTKSWAGGSAKVGTFFWSVEVSGKWQRIDLFESDANLAASVTFKGIEAIGIQASPWYTGVSKLQNGPYKRGYSKFGEGGTTAVFGKDGFLPLLKTAMYVAAGMSFDISVDQSTFNGFEQSFQAATAIRIGPFTFSADGGHQQNKWQADSSGLKFSGNSSSTVPQILGFTVNVLP